MADDIQSLQNDIAYLKALADSGQRRNRSGGLVLMAAGGIFSAASLVQWAAMMRLIPLTQAQTSLGWIVATLAFMAVLGVAKLRWRSDGTSGGASGLAWQGVGMGCFFIFAAIFMATWRTQNPLLIEFAPSMIFILYGAAWIVAAATMRKRWLHVTAWGAFIGALIVAWFIGDPMSYLLYAVGLILLAFVPGAIFVLGARD